MRSRIIIFQDNENNETWIHTDVPSTIMVFSNGSNIDKNLMVDLTDNGSWQFDGIIDEHSISQHEFKTIWSEGQAFHDDPDRIKKLKEKELLQSEIKKVKNNLNNLHYELEQMDNK